MKRFQIWSSGGGTQSSAIAVLILKGLLPRPDFAVIADTGRENPATWDYLENVVNPALQKMFVDFKIERIPREHPPSLWNGEGTLLIPAFGTDGQKLSNFCSSYWKRDVVKRWAVERDYLPAINWVGFSTEEMRRVATPRALNWLLEYPLIFKVPRSREGCENEIEQFGWPPAPKSACWMCPNQPNAHWRNLRDHHPEEWEKACSVDVEIRTRTPNAYLHRTCTALAQADLGKESDDAKQMGLGCNSGDCFV